ncbi:MAG TPA: hypothetical protein VKE70_00420 [Candidatus Solibacter sp.]|nr:hypothetical protein [Candidatus Solibacter sp.]
MLVAQGKGRGRGHDKDDSPKGNSEKGQTPLVFRTDDRNAITSYYRAQPGGLPPGLAKRESLPPGLEKQLRRNGKLPPGLEKKLVPFPPELESRLAPCPPEVTRGMIGGIAVMWSRQTGLVVDAAVLFR